MQNISWDEFRLVKAIAETGSLAGAGDVLALNHSTVFRRLNGLEQELGSRLFERARTGYVPTPAGEEMVTLATRMFDDITEFERRVAGRDVKPSGELRVTTNDSLVAHLATPLFGAFCRQYPEIKLDVVIDNRALNLSRRDADVAIRATAEPPETLVGRRIASIAWAVYGSKGCGIETTDDPALDVPRRRPIQDLLQAEHGAGPVAGDRGRFGHRLCSLFHRRPDTGPVTPAALAHGVRFLPLAPDTPRSEKFGAGARLHRLHGP
jgi:DNA-binding transcriptional LysR family regulator